MAGISKYNDNFKREIIDRYIAGEPVQALCKEFGFCNQTVYNWLEADGVVGRHRKGVEKAVLKRICHKCGRKEHLAQSKFCCSCGAKMDGE